MKYAWLLWLPLAISPTSFAVEIMRWERLPLNVPLQLGVERVVFVERNVRVGIPAPLSKSLRVQSAAGAVYLRALAPIEPSRVQLQDADSGELILLDVFTVEDTGPALESIRIVENATPVTEPAKSSITPIPVVLTRYAAQSLYAPLRTVEALPGVRQLKVPPHIPLEKLLPTQPLRTKALASWRLLNYHVTAIRLTNTSDQWIALDPRELQGDLISATFQHPDLGPKGDSSDTTTVYLVTRGHGLKQALPSALSPIDAAVNLPEPSDEQ
ncbi:MULTISPECIES: TIGR03749 family integrating conjugative element protein [unclassified Pseudomonas]|uniref:TIGR03749 family integrating conjugative element protein n=1 Tax=unclassified Pseudomonas TaxID=196821 RepID=UPI000C86A0C2|nr:MULTISPECIES: TIGR03749 family integrating conjugative element protein [unclassified Pseudomonas]PMV22633.1 TIGR03749 family integrating conjugative element protein [Pseudomonas sp. FW305-3-2-15-C-TSA2]PMV29296.1 TIGR03749 family integrating conjugative element protein [Pseudomonas sp. DP16D-L5]PMV39199.1 TIGR03749 family integrating conjugative element protein [Pseudomonas sp. FW305-3-2-15-A-LB2]PMV45509.1 TIGR03749 family integrating conjugative element protein [Pseudomonas sp. FW305-3-2-1